MKRFIKPAILITLAIAAVMLVSCIPGNGSNNAINPAGFFSGIWHGWIAPVSLVLSLFNRSYNIYEIYNTGFFYDLGFYAAIVGGFGGLSLARKKMKRDRE